MTTPEQTKAIEFGIGPHKASIWAHWGTSQLSPVSAADLLAAGYVPLSRALAAEAELFELKSALLYLNARNFDGHGWQPDRIVELARRQWHAAPPSPPVAPEPDKTACYCSDRMSGGLPCLPGKCPNVPCHCWPYNSKGEFEHDSTCPSRPVAPEPAPEIQMHTCRTDDPTDYCAACDAEYDAETAVAPEPAQENQECSTCSGTGTICDVGAQGGPTVPCPDCVARQPRMASSGEAAGDGVTHQQVAVALQAIAERPGSEKTRERLELLELYRQQQERFDRDMGHPHERAVAAVARAQQAESNRDAERAQKEALRVELERSEFLLSKARPLCGFVGKLNTESVLHPLVRGYIADWMEALIEQPTEATPVLSREEALDAMGEEVERHPLGGHGGAAPVVEPECWCARCQRLQLGPFRVFMSLCPKCGNKRCPKAEWHDYQCAGSNATGQVGVEEDKRPGEAAPVAKGEWRCPQCNDTLSGTGCVTCVYKRQACVCVSLPHEPGNAEPTWGCPVHGVFAKAAPVEKVRKRHTVDCCGYDPDCECAPVAKAEAPSEPEQKPWPRSVAERNTAERCSGCKLMWVLQGPCSPWCPGTRHRHGPKEPHPDLDAEAPSEPELLLETKP